ncbi:F-box domain [Quillaja saponaria]|uniref:F-box domain n=1 Tax=Quillaja saponaria TaxID=32244 RepID=A0AAD7LRY2_QUISA|nr:F-box domain [Quillaja saponaria]
MEEVNLNDITVPRFSDDDQLDEEEYAENDEWEDDNENDNVELDVDNEEVGFEYEISPCLEVLSLNLGSQVLKLPSFTGLSQLKSITLLKIQLTEDQFPPGFLSGCPLLENLTIEKCNFYCVKVLDLCAANLKHLRIIHNSLMFNCKLRISCPSLVTFNYMGPTTPDVS